MLMLELTFKSFPRLHIGPRASQHTSQQSMMQRQPASRKGTAMEQFLKISSEMHSNEESIISRLRREAAERANDLADMSDGFVSPLDPEFFGDDSSERQRKRSYLGRLDENNAISGTSHPRPITQRSISKELYELPDTISRHSGSLHHRPVTRRSVSRELFADSQFNPSWAPTSPTEYSRSSRERSLGRDTALDSLVDVERRYQQRRSESLSRPSLASQGRSLTQSELGSVGAGSSRRMSSGMRSPITVQDDDFLSNRLGGANRYSTLDERARSDWRRVSVPERGKDFQSLSKKYNR